MRNSEKKKFLVIYSNQFFQVLQRAISFSKQHIFVCDAENQMLFHVALIQGWVAITWGRRTWFTLLPAILPKQQVTILGRKCRSWDIIIQKKIPLPQ